ncbi:nitrite reductase small subunit NirD [Immundisolibacter sp.]|uniref:nitrite reductase small subunit NirD n=1 Tax=Immundisolibacter sp. TaxID=1934948 RepID=UPI0035671F40
MADSAALKRNPGVKPMWIDVCAVQDLPYNAGVAARIADRQIALFYLPAEKPSLYALDNWDPLGEAAVLARGIVGDLGGQLVVASPLYKQHFRLADGQCLEDPAVRIPAYPVRLDGDRVSVAMPDASL